jgi:arylsulfatase A-like enzyme
MAFGLFKKKGGRKPEGTRPNVVFVLIDMVRADHRTGRPIFAELGRRGVCFPKMFTHAPYTIASVHAFMSGMYGSLTGVDAYYKAPKFDGENCKTLAQHFSEAGYYCLADFMNTGIAPHQGFDEVRVHDEFKDDLLERHKAMLSEVRGRKPHFLYLHFSYVHRDVVTNVIKKFTDDDPRYFGPDHRTENEARYNSYLDTAEAYMTALLAHMDALGLAKDTIVLFMTDHGCGVGEKLGEKAYGIFAYDYTINVWAYLIQQGRLPGGREIPAMVRTIDLAPTLLELCGIDPVEGTKEMQGRSLVPMIEGKDGEDREVYVETAGLDGPTPSPYEANIFCVRNRAWKLIYNSTTKKRELYDLAADPAEQKNLAGTRPEVEEPLFEKIRRRYL